MIDLVQCLPAVLEDGQASQVPDGEEQAVEQQARCCCRISLELPFSVLVASCCILVRNYIRLVKACICLYNLVYMSKVRDDS